VLVVVVVVVCCLVPVVSFLLLHLLEPLLNPFDFPCLLHFDMTIDPERMVDLGRFAVWL
jgi:hypothetical protein